MRLCSCCSNTRGTNSKKGEPGKEACCKIAWSFKSHSHLHISIALTTDGVLYIWHGSPFQTLVITSMAKGQEFLEFVVASRLLLASPYSGCRPLSRDSCPIFAYSLFALGNAISQNQSMTRKWERLRQNGELVNMKLSTGESCYRRQKLSFQNSN